MRLTILIVLVALLCLFQYKLWVSSHGVKEVARLKRSANDLNRTNLAFEQRNAALTFEVNNLKKNNEVIEEHARQDLGLIKSGETYFQIFNPHNG